MDLEQLQPLETAEVIIIDPRTGEETDIRIEVLSTYNNEYRNRFTKFVSDNYGKDISVEEQNLKKTEFLVGMVVGWSNVSYKGEVLEFNEENKNFVISNNNFIKDQIDTFIGDSTNFFTKS